MMHVNRSVALLAAIMGAAGGIGIFGGTATNINQTGANAPSNTINQGERNTGSRGGFFAQDAARLNFGREPNPRTRNRRPCPSSQCADGSRPCRQWRADKEFS